MQIREISRFSRIVNKYFSEDEYTELRITLITNPALGVVIPGTGGIRKLRWKAAGRGKRGGYRVIYYWQTETESIWLLTIFSKSEQENISTKKLQDLLKRIE